MKLPSSLVADPAAQLNFEQLGVTLTSLLDDVTALQAQVGDLTFAAGVYSTWNWNGGNYYTNLDIPHGLGQTPSGFITSGHIRGSEATTDARAPWQVARRTAADSTYLKVVVVTRDKTTIGAFAANEPIYWLAWV